MSCQGVQAQGKLVLVDLFDRVPVTSDTVLLGWYDLPWLERSSPKGTAVMAIQAHLDEEDNSRGKQEHGKEFQQQRPHGDEPPVVENARNGDAANQREAS